MTPYTGQHLVLMKWIFSIKTDGTYKARLVGRGDLMIPWIDVNPKEIYCGNITACGIKLVLAIAASYKLRMRGGDLVGAYLKSRIFIGTFPKKSVFTRAIIEFIGVI